MNHVSPRDAIERAKRIDSDKPENLGREDLIDRLARAERMNVLLGENLSNVQARCTELLMEQRAVSKIAAPTADAIAKVVAERARQNEKWSRKPGEWPVTDLVKLAVLGEEVGEVSRAILEDDAKTDTHLRDELVQVAAVAIAWIEVLP